MHARLMVGLRLSEQNSMMCGRTFYHIFRLVNHPLIYALLGSRIVWLCRNLSVFLKKKSLEDCRLRRITSTGLKLSMNITKLKWTPLYLLGQHQSHKNQNQGCVTILMILHNRSTTRMVHNRLGLNF